nr:MAG TPA: urease accessory protein [Caudoviricetes sp.]
MAKIYRGNLPKKINVVINSKVYTVAEFNDEGIYITDDAKIIKELEEYGYRVEEEEKPLDKPKAKKHKEI